MLKCVGSIFARATKSSLISSSLSSSSAAGPGWCNVWCVLLTQTRTYFFESAKHIIPHPNKKLKGGEDAAFCGYRYLGVADGVGGWDSVGVDAGQYSKELLQRVEEALREHGRRSRFTPSPLEILKAAYHKTQAIGSSTCCLVFLDHYSRSVRTANLGDSGFLLFRPSVHEVVLKSEFQCHDFNFPVQLGTGSSDLPEHADVTEAPTQPGDWVLLASDGVWDNLYDDDILRVLERAPNPVLAAEEIAKAAYNHSLDTKRRSPFTERERSHSMQNNTTGGKPDDISVVAAKVKDPYQMRREDVPDEVAQLMGLDAKAAQDGQEQEAKRGFHRELKKMKKHNRAEEWRAVMRGEHSS
ncbi:unnamed protein product [Vitrella brassicaformis CCMP3155]|uniref:Protein phosphatase n=1 Tax=Vitrella brassicaformis (strain CCMP3155) TaxID=1169540 RepID=A0A0G4FMS4_VITBC|nr:unnamed protein product [Vitrella brassicaformis CCMP3155]|eukprot:CEM15543.1 unnamed protein product [Vitrella brassicaformis CCMP3155]